MHENVVLLVEDNQDDVTLTLEAFQAIKFPLKIEVVPDGAEALDYLFGAGKYRDRYKKNAPLLILLDLNMPKVGGLEVLRRLRAAPQFKDVLAVILSANVDEKNQDKALALGANLYIRKGASYREYINIAKRVHDVLAVSGSKE